MTLVLWMWVAGPVQAVTVPFTEDFATDAANWRDSGSVSDLTWVSAGGPDGGSYASASFSFVDLTDLDTPALFRAHSAFGSSGGAFAGDWDASGVSSLSMMVRHDTGEELTYFARFAGPANFPGAASIVFTPVVSDQWTKLSIAIPDPGAVYEGPFSFADVFGNIGNVQIGVAVPEALAGVDQDFNFDLDKVALVPEPTTLLLLGLGSWAMVGRRGRGGSSG
jgi:hypothetical protein